jgi:hypothetical protein
MLIQISPVKQADASAGCRSLSIADVARQRLPLAQHQRARLAAQIDAITCSQPWSEVAAAAAEMAGLSPEQPALAMQLRSRGIYPPRADAGPGGVLRRGTVRMKRCHVCGRIVPPNNLATHRLARVCDDCRIEPPADLDASHGEPEPARTPGVRSRTLMKDVIDDEHQPATARQRLFELGLTDVQITAVALLHAGYSSRRVAEMLRCSQTYICKLLNSANRKLRRSGLSLPSIGHSTPHQRTCSVDPVKLDAMGGRSAADL